MLLFCFFRVKEHLSLFHTNLLVVKCKKSQQLRLFKNSQPKSLCATKLYIYHFSTEPFKCSAPETCMFTDCPLLNSTFPYRFCGPKLSCGNSTFWTNGINTAFKVNPFIKLLISLGVIKAPYFLP